jgi:hypothetical protein
VKASVIQNMNFFLLRRSGEVHIDWSGLVGPVL